MIRNNTQLMGPTPESLFRSIVKRIGTASTKSNKLKLKKDIDRKYYEHMSLLQSHRHKQSRFQQNHNKVVWKKEQENQKLRQFITLRQKNSQEIKIKKIEQKRKKTQQALKRWQDSVKKNQNSYQQYLKNSQQFIKKWNQKCQTSIEKKNNLLNNISDHIRQKSRILSASSLKKRTQSYGQLQKALLNPQKYKSKANSSRKNKYSTVSIYHQNQREKSQSRMNTESIESLKKRINNTQQIKYLAKTVNKQTKIHEARQKKQKYFVQKRQQKNNKMKELTYLREKNLQYLKQKNIQMQERLDHKYKMIRQKKLEYSLPFVKVQRHQRSRQQENKNFFFTQLKSINSRAIQPTYDRLIIQELRNLSLIAKNKSKTKQY